MSWSDPCSKCGEHRADCECHKSKFEGVKHDMYLVDEAGQFPWHYKKDFENKEKYIAGVDPVNDEIKFFERVKKVAKFYNARIIKESNTLKYLVTLPKAYEIYEKLFGEPKTHAEWAERFNKVGDINRILMKK